MDMAGFQSAPSRGLSLSRSILLSSTFLAFSKFRFSFFLMVSILMLSYPVQSRGNQLQRKESGSLSLALWKLHLAFFLCRCIRFYICFLFRARFLISQ